MKKKYDYFHVGTPVKAENFGNYQEAIKFYGHSEKPATLWGVIEESCDYVCIKAK